MQSIGSPALWVGFTLFVLAMLALDLGVFNRRAHVVRTGEALVWTMVWIGLALLFGVGVYVWSGADHALEFLTGYLIEKALSVDNLFVFLVLFSFFGVPEKLQHRVLYWGILGALVTRAIFIVVGSALLQRFHWVMYIFGGFLVITGAKLLLQRKGEVHPERNLLFRVLRRLIPSVSTYREAHFVVVENGRRYATPLLLVLVAIESSDIIFAVDSIPAVFAITTDPFIVYTSNVFAVLGLRALYFVLSQMMGRFHYLQVGLALVLAFIGAKMLLVSVYKLPIAISLGVIAGLILAAIVASLIWPPRQSSTPPEA
jgi:tellurite resistance protein TerC